MIALKNNGFKFYHVTVSVCTPSINMSVAQSCSVSPTPNQPPHLKNTSAPPFA